MKNNKVTWAKYFMWGMVALTLYFIYPNIINGNDKGIGSDFVRLIIPTIVSILCAYKCSKWAKSINKNPNIAYIIGLFSGLVGLIGYFLFYMVKKD